MTKPHLAKNGGTTEILSALLAARRAGSLSYISREDSEGFGQSAFVAINLLEQLLEFTN
jgi:hypothetical protein